MHGIFFNDFKKDYVGAIAAEAYLFGIYDGFLNRNDMNIFEIGGHVGIVTLYFSKYAKNLYVMEPAEENFNCLKQTIDYNKLENVTAINKAINTTDSECVFYSDASNNTVFSMKAYSDNCSKKKIPGVCLSTVFEEYNIDYIDFMKIDIEGSEFDILAGESFKKEAHKIGSLMVEYHSWGGSQQDLKKLLKEAGFDSMEIRSPFGGYLFGAVRKDKKD